MIRELCGDWIGSLVGRPWSERDVLGVGMPREGGTNAFVEAYNVVNQCTANNLSLHVMQ